MTTEDIGIGDVLAALRDVATFKPWLAAVILLLSLVVGALEGIGLGFILPIIEVAQASSQEPSGPVLVFKEFYDTLGVPFTLEYIIAGVGVVIGIRYTAGFLSAWLTAALQTYYIRSLRMRAFDSALDAQIAYFDREGSDDILNAIITQTSYAGETINHLVRLIEVGLISLAYIAIALYLAPYLMIVTGLVLGILMYGVRFILESGYSVGDRVARANERVQQSVQAGTQGIRDVKMFSMADELFDDFRVAVDQYTEASITRNRNQAAINHANRFFTAAIVFVLVYIGVEFSTLSLGALGVFLFAMFRLGPKLSRLNDVIYRTESDLPHLIRTKRFLRRLEKRQEAQGERSVPTPVDTVTFDDVSFDYAASEEQVLRDVSFSVSRGEFVAFAGPSGAGKSTIVSLLVRMYDPFSGEITADGTPIEEFDLDEWRARVSVVRQNPYIFNDTLRYNVTIGNRDATQSEIERVCEIAQVTEFLDDLPNGYDTYLGDDGVRLSGGQRQRIAIARSLLKDSDLLVLDEATSDLDTHLEEKVHRGIENMERDYGMIAIAHRLSTVTGADCIHMMEDGRIIEEGPHDELLEREGAYYKLYSRQAGS